MLICPTMIFYKALRVRNSTLHNKNYSVKFPEVHSKTPIDSSRARTSYQFPGGQLSSQCWELWAVCIAESKYHQPFSLHSLFLWWFLHVVVSALYALEMKKLPQHSGFVLFISCNNKAWLLSIFQPKVLQGWKLEKSSLLIWFSTTQIFLNTLLLQIIY